MFHTESLFNPSFTIHGSNASNSTEIQRIFEDPSVHFDCHIVIKYFNLLTEEHVSGCFAFITKEIQKHLSQQGNFDHSIKKFYLNDTTVENKGVLQNEDYNKG